MTAGVAFIVSSADDDSYMLGESTYRAPPSLGFHDWRFGVKGVPHAATCGTCGRKTDPAFVRPDFRVVRRDLDLSATYDGYLLASPRFRFAFSRAPGVEFVRLPADDDFCVVRSTRIVEFDAARRGTQKVAFCPQCRAFYSVVGATPAFIKMQSDDWSDGFFRTDLEFGSGPEQHPLLIAAGATARALAAGQFRGVLLTPVAG